MAATVTFPTEVKAWAVKEGGGFQETKFTVKGLSPTEVFVKILACGVCHTDFFLLGAAGAIPGHEMVGVVQAVGSEVKTVRVGQRVGVGWQYSSCRKCEWCEDDQEILCKDKVNYMQRKGGFAEAVVWESHFVVPVPDNIPNEHAGPLMCAGLTVFNALRLYLDTKAKKQQRVAIVGIGGLGHVGLQFANKMGAHVTALSTSSSKEQEAKSLGAHAFLNTTNPEDLEKGVPKSAISVGAANLLMEDKQLVGSITGSPRDIVDMFEFVSKNDVKPLVEVLPISEIDKAIEKVEKNAMRYRMVLQIA